MNSYSLSSLSLVLIKLDRDEQDPLFERVFFCFAEKLCCSSSILFRLLRFDWFSKLFRSLLPPLRPFILIGPEEVRLDLLD